MCFSSKRWCFIIILFLMLYGFLLNLNEGRNIEELLVTQNKINYTVVLRKVDQNTASEKYITLSSHLDLKELYSLSPSMDGNDIYLFRAMDSNIKARDLCAAESWSLNHPSRNVWFTLTTKVAEDSDNLLKRLLDQYQNLHFAYLDFDLVFNNTPYQELISSNKWNNTYPEVNLSDIMRLALLSHTGGYYADSDAVAIKNMDRFRNFVGVPKPGQASCNVIHFDKNSIYLKTNMELQTKNFKAAKWGNNGPHAMNNAGKMLCGKSFMKKFPNGTYIPCRGVNFLPTKMFYPIYFTEFKKYFQKGKGKHITEIFKDTYVIHIWNKLSKHVASEIGAQSLYDVVARTNCPVVYNSMKIRNDHF